MDSDSEEERITEESRRESNCKENTIQDLSITHQPVATTVDSEVNGLHKCDEPNPEGNITKKSTTSDSDEQPNTDVSIDDDELPSDDEMIDFVQTQWPILENA